MPSQNDPTRDTQPLADEAPRVDGDHGRDEVQRLFTSESHDVENQPSTGTAVGPLPQSVRSFEDERAVVAALPESSLAQSSQERFDPHRQAESSALGSETARRQALTAERYPEGVEHRAVGRNPLAEAIFGDVNPNAEGPAPEAVLPGVSSDTSIVREPVEASLVSDDPRLRSYPPGPQPVDYLSDVNPETDEEAIVGEDEGASEAEAAVAESHVDPADADQDDPDAVRDDGSEA